MPDLERLDSYLSSDRSPSNSMRLSDLDGFLTGILCSPDLILPSEWLPVVWGATEPDAEDVDDHIWATQEVLARYNEIAKVLNSAPSYLEPIFWHAPEGHVIAMDWCEGFSDAMQMRPIDWDNFIKTEQGRDLMLPIRAHLFDDNNVSLSGVSEDKLDAVLDDCAKRIPDIVPTIFLHWQSMR